MGQVCILTDSTAQFPTAWFTGHHLIDVIALHIELNDRLFADSKGIKARDLPPSASPDLKPVIHPPSVEEFHQAFLRLSQRCDEIAVILLSSRLNPAVKNAMEAAEILQGSIPIHVIDSQTTAVGLGLLVQNAAELAANGVQGVELKRLISGFIPHIYTIFCLPGLTYLHHSGFLGPAQALVGEMLGVMPLFIMEEGQLIPIQKARSSRHLVDTLHEFVCEFLDLQHISVVQGVPPYVQEVRSLRERFNIDYPAVPISEHTIGPALAAMLGPNSLGIFVHEGSSDPGV